MTVTNTQEVNVDEPDSIKVSTSSALIANENKLVRVTLNDGNPRLDGSLDLGGDPYTASSVLTAGDRALVIRNSTNGPSLDTHESDVLLQRSKDAMASTSTTSGQPQTPPTTGLAGVELFLIDLGGTMRVLDHVTIQGRLIDARLIGSRVLMASSASPAAGRFIDGRGVASEDLATATNKQVASGLRPTDWLPALRRERPNASVEPAVSCDKVFRPSEFAGFSMLTTSSFDLGSSDSLDTNDTIGVVTSAESMYASASNLVVRSSRWVTDSAGKGASVDSNGSYTLVHVFDIKQPGPPRFIASTSVAGTVTDKFATSEREGHLRIVSTRDTGPKYEDREAELTTFAIKDGSLEREGSPYRLGQSGSTRVRFQGATALVANNANGRIQLIDLNDPASPTTIGTLQTTGSTVYLHPLTNTTWLALGQESAPRGQPTPAKVSVFDTSNRTAPIESSHADILDAHLDTDYHAFVWWPATNSALVPMTVSKPNEPSFAGLLVLNTEPGGVHERGRLSHPRRPSKTTNDSYATPIDAVAIVGSSIVTVSAERLQTNDLVTLAETGHVDLT